MAGPAPVTGLTFAEFAQRGREAFVAARGEAKGSGVAGELYSRFFREGGLSPERSGLTPASVALWKTVCTEVCPLSLEGIYEDEPGAERTPAKAVYRLADGHRIETVWIPMDATQGGRGTLCLSSQAGCAMACAFCETGRTGLLHNLSPAEIVGQVHHARFVLGWEFSNLVFMGMGEPLHSMR